jgi:hypothetical protein
MLLSGYQTMCRPPLEEFRAMLELNNKVAIWGKHKAQITRIWAFSCLKVGGPLGVEPRTY